LKIAKIFSRPLLRATVYRVYAGKGHSEMEPDVGDLVELMGLVGRMDLNGRQGRVEAWYPDKQRFGVNLGGSEGTMALKGTNLKTVSPTFWAAIRATGTGENAAARNVAAAVQGLRSMSHTIDFVVLEVTDLKKNPPPVVGDSDVVACCKVARKSEQAVPLARVIWGVRKDNRMMETLVLTLKRPDGAVPKRSTKDQTAMQRLVIIEAFAHHLERGEVITLPTSVRDIVNELGTAKQTEAARALLSLALPVIEADSGPTPSTAFLRTILGELCEELKDYEAAIRAYLGVTTECCHVLKPIRVLMNPGFIDGPPKEAAYQNLGLAYKRAGKYDLSEQAYIEALQGARHDDYSGTIRN
jgi:hypothetical protein